jgi:hypothetical protein
VAFPAPPFVLGHAVDGIDKTNTADTRLEPGAAAEQPPLESVPYHAEFASRDIVVRPELASVDVF